MRSKVGRWTGIIALTACVTGCGEDDEEEVGLTAWKGETPHFAVEGFLNGETLDFSLEGDAVATATCEREYAVPTVAGAPDLSMAEGRESEIVAYPTVNGETRQLQLELKEHNLQADEPGTRVKIVPRTDDGEPADTEMWLEMEWHSEDGEEDIFEGSAQQGTLTIESFSGTPGAGGVIIPDGEGVIGAFIDARWSVDEIVRISFTVPCGDNQIKEDD